MAMLPADLQPDPAGYLSSRDVRTLLRFSSARLWDEIRRGRFPHPDLVVTRSTRYWLRSTVEAWIADHHPGAEP